MAEDGLLAQYYLNQATSGASPFYSGPIYHRGGGTLQRGAGIGSFLGGLFRRILPVLKKGATVAGREVINSGAHFMNDINKNVSPRIALKKRAREAVVNLTKKTMIGDGYKKSASSRKRQLNTTGQSSKTKRRRIVKSQKKKPSTKRKATTTTGKTLKKKKTRDIFSN